MPATLTSSGKDRVATFTTDGASQTTPSIEFRAGRLSRGTIILNPGSAHAITVQVSNDGVTWMTAKDMMGVLITKATAGAVVHEIETAARFMRVISAASSTGSTTTFRWV